MLLMWRGGARGDPPLPSYTEWMKKSKDRTARDILHGYSFGVLSTMSVDVPGYPFGSIAPYCVDRRGRPVIYTSFIAQHTKNFLANPKVSLTVVEAPDTGDDVQAHGRITCLANVTRLQDPAGDAAERYFRHFPSARQYEHTHDFAFFVLELVRIRFIGGFGKIFWVEPVDFVMMNPFSPSEEARILEHMNLDHSDALKRYAGGEPAVMTGIDAEGFDILSGDRKVRVSFDIPIQNVEHARQALIALVGR